MAELPVPGEIFWNDFSFSLNDFEIHRNSKCIGTFKGILDDNAIFFKPDTNIKCGDTVMYNGNTFTVNHIENETYCGKVELISVHY